jgi:hypothetical protein
MNSVTAQLARSARIAPRAWTRGASRGRTVLPGSALARTMRLAPIGGDPSCPRPARRARKLRGRSGPGRPDHDAQQERNLRRDCKSAQERTTCDDSARVGLVLLARGYSARYAAPRAAETARSSSPAPPPAQADRVNRGNCQAARRGGPFDACGVLHLPEFATRAVRDLLRIVATVKSSRYAAASQC